MMHAPGNPVLRLFVSLLISSSIAACGGATESDSADELSGPVVIDGSSTVYPITEALAEEFQIANRETRVTVGISGTGGGFQRFCSGQTDMSDASRPISESERALCEENGIGFTELRVAWDGLSVVTNPSNDFVSCFTVDELKAIWEPGSQIDNWNEIRPGFPNKELSLYGPGTDSGTFDYFTEAIVGEEDASRADYTASENDNVLVQGVIADPGGLGYFGYAYYEENAAEIRLLGIDSGSGCIEPTVESIETQTYTPLSRPLYIYVSDQALEKPQVRAFVEFFLTQGAELVASTGYIPLKPEQYSTEMAKVEGGPADGTPADTLAE